MDSEIIFYFDDDVHRAAATIARNRGLEVVLAEQEEMASKPDTEHFVHAIERGYVLVTVNRKDFQPLFEAWLAEGKEHPGLIIIPGKYLKNATMIADNLGSIVTVGGVDAIRNQIWWVAPI